MLDSSIFYPILCFWLAYGVGILILPVGKSITRNKITNLDIIQKHGWNIFYSLAIMPLIHIIPTVHIFPHTFYGIICRYTCSVCIIEGWFYYVHRLLHHPYFYKYHRDHHVFIQSNTLASLYCSPVEMVLLNLFSIILPFRLFTFSTPEMIGISVLIALNVIKGHATFHLLKPFPSWVPLVWYQNWDHDDHHRLMNYNFGLLSVLDRIHGTRHDRKNKYI